MRANVSGGEEERCGTKETHKRWEEEGHSPCIWEINNRTTLDKQFSQENKQDTTAVTEAASPQAGALYKQIQSNQITKLPHLRFSAFEETGRAVLLHLPALATAS